MHAPTTPNPGTSSEALRFHYDIGNDFYRLWLDSSMTYSCALWDEGEGPEAHEIAQMRKLDFHCDQAQAAGAAHVLDVGCGWGSLLKRLVNAHRVRRAVGLTMTRSHAEHVASFGDARIEARLEPWSEHQPAAPYDAIISLEAFEHFAKLTSTQAEKVAGYRAFFSRCHEWLKPGGRLSVQTIVYENSRKENFSRYCAEHVFPDSDLPRLSDIASASERLFEVVALRSDRAHYVRTFKDWHRRLRANREAATRLVGAEAVERYDRYCSLFMIGFQTGAMNLVRATLRRIDAPCA